MRAILHFDGACRGNPGGLSAGGAVISFPYGPDGPDTASRLTVLGAVFQGTNNEAEYHGLLAGLHEALEVRVRHLEIFGDSMLVVRQVKGEWRVNKAHLRPLCAEAMTLLKNFDSWTIAWVPREQNREADRASNQAIDSPRKLDNPRRTPA